MSEQSAIEFPCDFPIKIMGRESPEFQRTARNLIEHHVGPIATDAIRINTSGQGNFVSVTVTVTVSSQQQLDNIYRDVAAHKDVLMTL